MNDTRGELRQALAQRAIELAAIEGIESLSLRRVSAAASATTAAIVYHFGNKAGLQQAAIELALEQERQYHENLAAQAWPQMGYLGFVDRTADYVLARTKLPSSKFLLELLYARADIPAAPGALREWNEIRYSFWRSALAIEKVDPNLAKLIVPYLCMEEVCASSMHSIPGYGPLIRETIRALLAQTFGKSAAGGPESYVCEWLDEKSEKSVISSSLSLGNLPEKLIEKAALEVLQSGIGSLNQRKIAKLANTSASMITYHFGGKSEFDIQAIWQAMIRDRPSTVFLKEDESHLRKSFAKWTNEMAKMIMPATKERKAGFFLNYARMTGEIALSSCHQPSILPLAIKLRFMDGQNTYQTSKHIWVDDVPLSRSAAAAYSVWSKGLAVINDACKMHLKEDHLSESLRDSITTITGWLPE